MRVRFAVLSLALSVAGAALGFATPTHEVTREFQATIAGETILLPAGSPVEILPGSGPTRMARHILSNGTITLLSIPATSLRPMTKGAAIPPSPSPRVADASTPAATPVASATPSAGSTKLSTTDGTVLHGDLIRVEKHYAVLRTPDSSVVDVLLKSLDERSSQEVERWKLRAASRPFIPDPRVEPGKKISLPLPGLGASRSSDPAQITIRIPENYHPDRVSPIALYLAGGEGSDNCDAAKSFVDPTEWILVAFPYPKDTPRPLYVAKERKAAAFISGMEPFLERLQAIVPNTEPTRRVVIGTSNGAHTIGIAASDGWDAFTDYFHAFVLHEGGASERGDFQSLRRKAVFVAMGAKSDSLDFAESIEEALRRDRVKPESFVAPDEGHGLGNASREAIRQWILSLPTKKSAIPGAAGPARSW